MTFLTTIDDEVLFALLNNSALLLALVVLYQLIPLQEPQLRKLPLKLISGFILGGIGIVLMLNPWEVMPGLIFDTRSILLGLAGLFFGWIPAFTAGSVTALYRIGLGGPGAFVGVTVIYNSVFIGLLWRFFHRRWRGVAPQIFELYLFGLIVHLAMMLTMLLLPGGLPAEVLGQIFWPTTILYPLATVLVGLLLAREEKRRWDEINLRTSEQRLQDIFAALPVMLDAFDASGNIVAWNPACERITGYSAAEIIGNPRAMELLYPDPTVRARIIADFSVEKDAHKPTETTLRAKDGTLRTIAWYAQATAEPLPGWQNWAVGVDVTDRSLAETALREQKALLQTIIDNLPVVTARLDPGGQVQFVNQEWVDILGWTVPEMQAAPDFLDLFFFDRELRAEAEAFMQIDRGEWREFPTQAKDGTIRHIAWTNVLLPDGSVIGIGRDVSDRRETERALAASEQLFTTLTRVAPVGIFRADVNGRLTYFNQELGEIVGSMPPQQVNENWIQQIHPADQEKIETLWQRMIADHIQLRAEWRFVRENGDVRWVLGEAAVLPDPVEGRPQGFVGAVTDITALRSAEEETRMTAQRLKLATSVAGLGIWELDVQRNVLTWDTRMFEIYQVDPGSEVDFDTWRRRILPDDLLETGKAVAEAIAGERPLNTRFRITWPDGQIRHVVVRGDLRRDDQGHAEHLIGVNWDITEQVHMLEQMQVQTAQLQQIMASVPEGVVLLNDDDRVLIANPRGEEYLQRLAAAAVGQKLEEVAGQPLRQLLRAPDAGEWVRVELDGSCFNIGVQPLETGPLSHGAVLVISDVTAELDFQQQLQRQERLAAIGQLAAGIAHDFNNIMAVIVLYTEMLQMEPSLSTQMQTRLQTIHKQANLATRLIQQILDFSRRAVLESRPLDLYSLLQEQIKMLRRTLPENIEIRFRGQEGDYVVLADLTRLQQTLMNLVVNSRDAMPDGGRLDFYLSRLEINGEAERPLPRMEPGRWIRLDVTDNGSGISPADLEHVFEPFFTTKEVGKGTGLGLAQIHGIVGQHGGFITVESELGTGTTFTIYLPEMEIKEEGGLTRPSLSISFRGNGETILVVEDEAVLRDALRDSLHAWGYQVQEAVNGQAALRLIKENGAALDLIISDVVMPHMGGIELIKSLRETGVQTPVLLMTGHALGEDHNQLLQQGVHAVLPKPIASEKLAATVRTVLRKHGR